MKRNIREGYYDEDEGYAAFSSDVLNQVDLGNEPSEIYDDVYAVAISHLDNTSFITTGDNPSKIEKIASDWTERWMDEHVDDDAFLEDDLL